MSNFWGEFFHVFMGKKKFKEFRLAKYSEWIMYFSTGDTFLRDYNDFAQYLSKQVFFWHS